MNDKIALIDTVLNRLFTSDCKTIPELIDGFQNFPLSKSEKDLKYRIIENELINLNLAEKVRGGDNSTISGYIEFKLSPQGMELIESQRSVQELYDKIEKESQLNLKIKEYSLEKLKYEKAIREQEQKIRDLTKQFNIMSLIQKYWWFLTSILGLGYLIAKFLDRN